MSASSGKSKFFGFLKNVFQKSSNNGGVHAAPVEAEAEEPMSIHSAPPIESAPRPAAPPPRRRPNPYGNGHGATAAAATAAPATAMIQVSLQAVINSLPLELRGKVVHPEVGDARVAVPLDKVLSQLGQGVVKVPFGDIRESAPYAFTPEADSDRIAVTLPLNEILSQLNPGLLVRRQAQKSVEVPSDITSPFDGKGEGLVFSVGNNAKPVAPASPRQMAPAPATPARGSISSVPFPPPPAAAPHPPQPTLSPAAPISMPKFPPASAPASPVFPMSQASHTPPPPAPPISFGPQSSSLIPAEPFGAPPRPIVAKSPVPTPPAAKPIQPVRHTPPPPAPAIPMTPFAPLSPATPMTPMAPVAPAAPTVQFESAKSVSDAGALTVPLKALAEAWPDLIRQEIVQTGLVETRVALPVDAIEPALKRGRAAFPWKTLRSWIRPQVPPSASIHDATELELPLKVVAPLFLARQSAAAKAQPKQTIDETIPNLFFGFPKPEAPAAPAAPSPTALPKPPSVSSEGDLISQPNKPTDTNYYVWNETSDTTRCDETESKRPSGGTDFVARYATPNEIVSRAGALEGVAGALIALPDGLMVASRLSPEINGDTLAAFLPQIFAKVNQCTRELRMGELNNLNFTVGNIPWKIFRVNAIFFAAFGRVAEPLPTAALAALAAELDRKR